MKLKDKVFIITGISSGMGKAAAEQFTAEGAIVVGSVRKEADAQIWDDNDRVLPVLADVNHLPPDHQRGDRAGGHPQHRAGLFRGPCGGLGPGGRLPAQTGLKNDRLSVFLDSGMSAVLCQKRKALSAVRGPAQMGGALHF